MHIYLSENPSQSNTQRLTFIDERRNDQIGERDCVATARDWFRWDDDADNSVANKTAEEEFWAKFEAAWDEATAAHIASTTPIIRRKSNRDIPPSANVAPTPWPADTITCDANGDLRFPPHYVRDGAEAQERILKASNSPSLEEINMDFYWESKSGLPLADMHARFTSRLPSVSEQRTNPQILCGHIGNENQKPVGTGIYMEKINIRAIPWGRAPKRIDATTRRLIIDADGAWKKTFRRCPRSCHSMPTYPRHFVTSGVPVYALIPYMKRTTFHDRCLQLKTPSPTIANSPTKWSGHSRIV